VGTNDLAANAVTTAKIADGAVTSNKIANGAVGALQLADGSITTLKIQDGSLLFSDLGKNNCNPGQFIRRNLADSNFECVDISPGGVQSVTAGAGLVNSGTPQNPVLDVVGGTGIQVAADQISLAPGYDTGAAFDGRFVNVNEPNSVNSTMITDGSVTFNDWGQTCGSNQIPKYVGGAWTCADDNIGSPGSGDITSVQTPAGSGLQGGVMSGDAILSIADQGVTSQRIADGAVTNPKLAANAVGTTNLQDGAVTSAKIQDGQVTLADLASNSVDSSKIQDGAVTTAKLADNSVTTVKIGDAQVTSGKIADGQVQNPDIADLAVGTSKISDGAVTNPKLATDAVTSAKIQDGTIVWQDTDTSSVQRRVTGTCSGSNAIQVINADGTVACGGGGGGWQDDGAVVRPQTLSDQVSVGTAAPPSSALLFSVYSSSTGFPIAGQNTAGSGNAIGVYGESSYSPSGVGVYGQSVYNGTGSNPVGVYGVARASTGRGVFGYNSSSGNGVRGESLYGTGIEGYAWNTGGGNFGVYGYTNSPLGAGVYGYNGASSGGTPVGVEGKTSLPNGYGVYGETGSSSGAGIYGYAPANSQKAGYFNGGFTVVNGTKPALVPTPSFGWRYLYAMESPEVWFEDFGTAKLTNGKVTVSLDPIFKETINSQEPYHVFLTPLSEEPVVLTVTEKSETGFSVLGVGLDGKPAEISFDYRIVAKRKGYEGVRLEQGEPLPPPPSPPVFANTSAVVTPAPSL